MCEGCTSPLPAHLDGLLKPCPLCGGVNFNYIYFMDYMSATYFSEAVCRKCGLKLVRHSQESYEDSDVALIRGWNTRVPEAPFERKLEKLIEGVLDCGIVEHCPPGATHSECTYRTEGKKACRACILRWLDRETNSAPKRS